MEDKFEETEMMIVGHLGAVSYGFSEPDIA